MDPSQLFTLGKMIEPLLMPLGVGGILLLLGLLLSWKRPWIARFLTGTALVLLWVSGTALGPRELLGPLEKRYPIPPESLRAEAAVVLAGTVDLARSDAERIELYDRPERILEGARLVTQGRAERLVISGGSGDPLRPEVQEARFLAQLARRLGVPSDAILIQGKSRTTHEDALHTAELLRKRGLSSFFLVTSAYHMPRAVACFRRQGTEPIPYPVDFRAEPPLATTNPYLPTASRLRLTTLALHEWYGLAVYWVQGYL